MELKVIVVDPYQLARRGITSILLGEPRIKIYGEAANYIETLNLIETHHPDVCVINNRINQQSGLDVIQKLKKTNTSCRFLYLTSSMKPSELNQALTIGVEGVILKESLPEELIFAVRLVGRGRKYYEFELLEWKLMENQHENDHHLTPKEQEVLQMISEGLSNKAIALRLFVTEYTVKKHVSQILSKLNLPDRTKAALFYFNQGQHDKAESL